MDKGVVADSERHSRDISETIKPLLLIIVGFLLVVFLVLRVGADFILIAYIPIMLYIFSKKMREVYEIIYKYQIKPGEKIILTSAHRARLNALAPLSFLLLTGLYLLITNANPVYLFAFFLSLVVSVYSVIKEFTHASEVYVDLKGIGYNRQRYKWDEVVSVLFAGEKVQFYEILTKQGKKLRIKGRSRRFELLIDAHLVRIEPAEKANKIRWKAKDRIDYVPVDMGDRIGIELNNKTNTFNKPLPKSVTVLFALGVVIFLIYGVWWLLYAAPTY